MHARTLVDGRLGPVVDLLAAGGVLRQDVALDAAGNATVGWVTYSKPTDGSRGPLVGLSRARIMPATSVSDSGRVVFAWGTARGVVARTLSPASELGPVHRLTSPGERPRRDFGISTVGIASGEYPVVSWITGSLARAASGP